MPQDGLFWEYLIRPKRAAALGKVMFVDIYTHSARLRRRSVGYPMAWLFMCHFIPHGVVATHLEASLK
jgi:hypothetical protein